MSETKHSVGHSTAANVGPGPEPSDLKPGAIAIFGLGLAVVVVACLIVATWMFNFFASRRAEQDVSPSPLARVESPAGPVLQVNAPRDLARLRAEEDATLASYGWVNQAQGVVRIPIDRAMELLVERGLPAPGQKSQPQKVKRP